MAVANGASGISLPSLPCCGDSPACQGAAYHVALLPVHFPTLLLWNAIFLSYDSAMNAVKLKSEDAFF